MRGRTLALIASVSLAGAACGGGGADPQPFVDALAASLRGGDLELEDDVAECVAERGVEVITVERLQEAGVTPEELERSEGPQDLDIELSEDEAEDIARSFVDCDAPLVDFVVAELGEDSEECVEDELDEDAFVDSLTQRFLGNEDEADERLQELLADLGGCSVDLQAFVDAISASLQAPDEGFALDDATSDCIAQRAVDVIGADRLVDSGVTPEELGEADGPQDVGIEVSIEEATTMAEAFVECEAPLASALADALVADEACVEDVLDVDQFVEAQALTFAGDEAASDAAFEELFDDVSECAGASSAEEEAFVDAVAASLRSDPTLPLDDDQSTCFASELVDIIGVDVLVDAGISPEDLGGATDFADLGITLSEEQAGRLADAFPQCGISIVDLFVISLETTGAVVSDDLRACLQANLDEAAFRDVFAQAFLDPEGFASNPPQEFIDLFVALGAACPELANG